MNMSHTACFYYTFQIKAYKKKLGKEVWLNCWDDGKEPTFVVILWSVMMAFPRAFFSPLPKNDGKQCQWVFTDV